MKKICILYTSAGAGHRSVARALALELQKDPKVKVETVDFSQDYHLPVFRSSEGSYKFSLKYLSGLYGMVVWLVDQKLPHKTIKTAYYLAAHGHFDEFLLQHPADIYLSTSYFDIPLFKYIKENRPKIPVIMLVTDIVYPLRIWFDKIVDLTIVPSRELYERGLKYFKNFKNKVKVMGLPLAPVFFKHKATAELKKELGLPSKKTIFISGGGEGMPQIPAIVRALDEQLTDVNIVAVCGKDKKQKTRLDQLSYRNNVVILGWTDKFAEYLIACDLVITKAGATTIWEAMTARKKTILFDYIRGQESGNKEFAQKYFGAKYIKDPEKIALAAKEWLNQKLNITGNAYMDNWTEKIALLLIHKTHK